jgi:hypothetical protein
MIIPVDERGSFRTGVLPRRLSVNDIKKVLGFGPNVEDDPDKIKYSWAFTVDGTRCGIWDYKGVRWSVYDPENVLPGLFGTKPEVDTNWAECGDDKRFFESLSEL